MSFNVANCRSFSSSSENGKMNCTPEEHPSLSAQNIVLPLSLPFQVPTLSLTPNPARKHLQFVFPLLSSPLLDGRASTPGSLPALQPPSPPENGNAVCGRQMISVDIRHISADRLLQAGGPRRTTRHAGLFLPPRLTPSPHSINLSEREHGSLMWSR